MWPFSCPLVRLLPLFHVSPKLIALVWWFLAVNLFVARESIALNDLELEAVRQLDIFKRAAKLTIQKQIAKKHTKLSLQIDVAVRTSHLCRSKVASSVLHAQTSPDTSGPKD